MNELLTAVRESRAHDVPDLLAGMDLAERRAALAELKAIRKQVRNWSWDKQDKVRKALLVAGAGCHTGAAACAAWIGSRDLAGWGRSPFPLVLAVLSDRDPEWLGDVAHRLAARPATAETTYELISGLVKKAQCPVPTTEGFVRGWAEAISTAQWHRRTTRPLVETLRTDPFAATLLPRIFEVTELPSQMLWPDDASDPCRWSATLAALPEEGLLERPVLVEACVTRLLRGGKLNELRFFLSLLRKLELTEQEETERVADWTGMAADGISTVAGHAQGCSPGWTGAVSFPYGPWRTSRRLCCSAPRRSWSGPSSCCSARYCAAIRRRPTSCCLSSRVLSSMRTSTSRSGRSSSWPGTCPPPGPRSGKNSPFRPRCWARLTARWWPRSSAARRSGGPGRRSTRSCCPRYRHRSPSIRRLRRCPSWSRRWWP